MSPAATKSLRARKNGSGAKPSGLASEWQSHLAERQPKRPRWQAHKLIGSLIDRQPTTSGQAASVGCSKGRRSSAIFAAIIPRRRNERAMSNVDDLKKARRRFVGDRRARAQ